MFLADAKYIAAICNAGPDLIRRVREAERAGLTLTACELREAVEEQWQYLPLNGKTRWLVDALLRSTEQNAAHARELEGALRGETASPALIEALATREHEQWMDWMQWQYAHPERAEGWRRLASTPYADLTEREKESDREEARKVLGILARALLAPAQSEEQGK
jgi:hypothetical protein